PHTLSPQVRMASEVSPENQIQRQCADCASPQQEQSTTAGKDIEQISSEAGAIQTKLTVGAPGDPYEQEADRVAAQVVSMSAPPDNSAPVQRLAQENNPIQRWSLAQSITPVVQRRLSEQVQTQGLVQRAFQAGGTEASEDLESRLNASKGGGSPLSKEVRAFMEPRFGSDFSGVRVHTGSEAVQMSRQLGAQAFTHERDIFFGEGKSPGNNELTAHELTHVVQQTGGIQLKQIVSLESNPENSVIQRFSWSDVTETAGRIGNTITDVASSVGEQVEEGVNYLTGRPERERAERERPERERDNPGNFCTPYSSRAEIYAAKTYLWTTLIPSATGMFGADVAGLWRQYLSGPSSGYRTFAKGSNIANAFAQSNVIRQHTEILMDRAINRLDQFEALEANTWVDVPVENVFTTSEINFPINFNNPFDIPGHIAGGASGSDFGPDTRKLKGHLSVYRESDDTGNTIGYKLKAKFEFEVKDAVDFCPGGAGAGLEQVLTIPASRLEKSGEAFDVPFEVQFAAPEITRTIGSASSHVSSGDSSGRHRNDRQDVTRGLETASRG
ncbi:eCIS core domain-containing protein, partial [Coleofasciculus sp.]|uniref:eCIS core domain-containing protein n=1 Tax=Coleofasciculus sp. TaxID=3100458 RepID=UPI003A1B7FBF